MVNTRESTTDSEKRTRPYRSWNAYGDEGVDDTFSLDSAFKDLIQRDPVVCDNCFLKKYTRVTHEWWRGSFGWLDYEQWIPFPEHVDDIPGDTTASGTRLTCSFCGHRSTKTRPIPKSDILDYADHISNTLDLKEVEHDRRILFHEVERRNTSENQGKQDSHVFTPAVRLAIERQL